MARPRDRRAGIMTRVAIVLLIAGAVAGTGCVAAPASIASPSASATQNATPSATASASATPNATTASPTLPATPVPTATPDCATRTLARMTLEQRIGQLFLLGLADDRLGTAEVDAIHSQHFGSVWFVERSSAGVAAIRAVADSVQALATAETTAQVRFFIAANQEGGLIQSLSGAGFTTIPSALDQSAIDPAALRAQATTWARQLDAAGVNLNFAPVLDVVPPGTDSQNEPIGVLRRGYGHDAATVSAHGVAFLRGMTDARVATSAKHFPGLGRVRGNTDFTSSVVDTETAANDPSLTPFRDAIAAGVPFVMVALATYERIDATRLAVFSPTVMVQLLRGSLGFDGVVVSDDVGATAAVASVAPGDRATSFIAAGGDLIISKTVAPAITMATALRERASAEPSFRTRIDDAALHVLRAKVSYGLIACGV